MKPYKACFCRDPETGKEYGKKCPDRGKRRHGKWFARYEAPPGPDGKRRQPRIGPYDTERECSDALAAVLGRVGQTGHVDDRKIKVGPYLAKRLAWRESEAASGDGLKPSTLDAEREAIELYFRPGIGHLKLVDLRDHHLRDLVSAMRLINREGQDDPPAELADLLQRLLDARATRDGRRISTRPLSEARIRRIMAVLTGALNDAVKVSKLIGVNPADGLFKSKGGGKKKGRIKPLLWTAERVERWEETGRVPGPVMVWTSTQCGAFLDFAEASGERLYSLFHVDAYWGPRRGELVALDRADLGIDTRRMHIRAAQHEDELDDPKSENSDRVIVFDEQTQQVLKAWRKAQLEERMLWGEAYTDSGRVWTYEDGRPLRPAYVSQRFELLVERYQVIRRRRFIDEWSVERIARHYRQPVEVVHVAIEGGPLPPIRFHDLRHGAATMLLASGATMKLVSDVLGHASSAFTSDVYAVVAEELAEAAARAIAAFIPRRNKIMAVRASNVPAGAGN